MLSNGKDHISWLWLWPPCGRWTACEIGFLNAMIRPPQVGGVPLLLKRAECIEDGSPLS